MMKFKWDQNAITWYRRANEYTGFYNKIAQIIKPMLKGYSSLCDIGCGIGLLDLELHDSIESITCTDINQNALQALQETIDARGIQNMKTQLMDCNEISGQWDIIGISFFGSNEFETFLPHCKKLIAVIHGDDKQALSPGKYKKFTRKTSQDVEDDLIRKGIPHSVINTSFEFGQPLTSIEEGKAFVRSYTPDISNEDLKHFLSEKMVQTEDDKYPFYIPRTKAMGIFDIEGQL